MHLFRLARHLAKADQTKIKERQIPSDGSLKLKPRAAISSSTTMYLVAGGATMRSSETNTLQVRLVANQSARNDSIPATTPQIEARA